jgi:hypothetical protein
MELHHSWHTTTHWVSAAIIFFISIKAHSVVNIIPAEAAFSNATLLLGSIIPAASKHIHLFCIVSKSPEPSATLQQLQNLQDLHFLGSQWSSTARDTI